MLASDNNQLVDLPIHPHVEYLYLNYRGWLQHWLKGRLGSYELAADLAQDTFLRIIASRAKINTLQNPKAYLSSIAKNLVVDHWRHREVEDAYVAALQALPERLQPSVEESQLILEALEKIDQALHSLPADSRRIFFMSQLEGFTYQEIADHLNYSLRTVKRHMQTAFLTCMQLDLG